MNRGGGSYKKPYNGKKSSYQGKRNNGSYNKSPSNYKGNGKPKTDSYNGYQGNKNKNYNGTRNNNNYSRNKNHNDQGNRSQNLNSRNGGNYSSNNRAAVSASIEPITEENLNDSNNSKIFKFININLKDYKKRIPGEQANVRESKIEEQIKNDIIVEYRPICRFFLMNFDKIEFIDVNRNSIENYLKLIVDERHIEMKEHFKQFTLLNYMIQQIKEAFKLQRHIDFDGVSKEEYNKWKLEQDELKQTETITFADEPFEFDEELVDFEEAFADDKPIDRPMDRSINTNGSKLKLKTNVLPTVIEENEPDVYIPTTKSSRQQEQEQEQQKESDETSWDMYRPSTRWTPVSSNGLFVSDSESSPQKSGSTSSLPSQSNSQQSPSQSQQSTHKQQHQQNQQNLQTTSPRRLPPTGPKSITSSKQSNSSNWSSPSYFRPTPTEPKFQRRIRDYEADEPSEEEKLLIERRKKRKLEEKRALFGKVFHNDEEDHEDDSYHDDHANDMITSDDLFYHQMKSKKSNNIDNTNNNNNNDNNNDGTVRDIEYKTFIERLKSYNRKKNQKKDIEPKPRKSLHPKSVQRGTMKVKPNKFDKILALID